jgi:hypothetical protein
MTIMPDFYRGPEGRLPLIAGSGATIDHGLPASLVHTGVNGLPGMPFCGHPLARRHSYLGGCARSSYQVRVSTTTDESWIQATSDDGRISFQGVVPPNHTSTFVGVDGKMSVQLGAVGVNLKILIPGVSDNWGFTTSITPYTVSFASLK